MSRYGNTRSVTIGGIRFARPPRGTQARAWDRLRHQLPYLDGARVHTDPGGRLQVELHDGMASATVRVAAVEEAARYFRCEVRRTGCGGGPLTHWIFSGFSGVEIIIATREGES